MLKRALGADLIKAVRAVAKGESFLYPSVATTVMEQFRHSDDDAKQDDQMLTTRELEILRRVAIGETNGQIALELNISVRTVEWHRGKLMNKLEVHSVAELVRYAIEHDLT